MATVGGIVQISQENQLSNSQHRGVVSIMTNPVEQHKSQAPRVVTCSVLTVSDSRTLETDTGGRLVIDLLKQAGHTIVLRTIVRDEPERIIEFLQHANTAGTQAALLTGGTGIGPRDQTYETLTRQFDRVLPGYGELFRMLSYQEIGAAAILSRATAGVMGHMIVLSMPGSPAAVQLAMEKIILPELPHLVREVNRHP
jgi:molybdenum cofactor biosynthesis protein B